MNEVGSSHLTNPLTATPASAKVSAETKGNTVSTQPAKPAEEKPKPSQVSDPAEVERAVASINQYVQSIQRELQFSIDDQLETTVVKVIDSDSGKVIRQIPEEVVLELARRLTDGGSLQLLHELG